MNIVKSIKGVDIERREHRGNEYFVLHFPGGGWNIVYSLKEAASLVKLYYKEDAHEHERANRNHAGD